MGTGPNQTTATSNTGPSEEDGFWEQNLYPQTSQGTQTPEETPYQYQTRFPEPNQYQQKPQGRPFESQFQQDHFFPSAPAPPVFVEEQQQEKQSKTGVWVGGIFAGMGIGVGIIILVFFICMIY